MGQTAGNNDTKKDDKFKQSEHNDNNQNDADGSN